LLYASNRRKLRLRYPNRILGRAIAAFLLRDPEDALPTFQNRLALTATVFNVFVHRLRCSRRRQIPHKISPQLVTEMLHLYPPPGGADQNLPLVTPACFLTFVE
jgi:hypothetical protein